MNTQGRLEQQRISTTILAASKAIRYSSRCRISARCCTAVQNDLDEDDARRLIENGCRLVAEGANMPCTSEAVDRLQADQRVLFGPGKAANAGGVAVSGLERSQNAQFLVWSKDEVDRKRPIKAVILSRAVYR